MKSTKSKSGNPENTEYQTSYFIKNDYTNAEKYFNKLRYVIKLFFNDHFIFTFICKWITRVHWI